MSVKSIQTINTEYSKEAVAGLFFKLIKDRPKRNVASSRELAITDFFCPLWIMTVRASFKRFLLKDYRILTGVAVDGWMQQPGSIGVMPGCEEKEIDCGKILDTHCTQETAEQKAVDFLNDGLTLRYRSVPKLEIKKNFLVYQQTWVCRYTNEQGRVRFGFIDGVSGRQLYRYDNKLNQLAQQLSVIGELCSNETNR